MRYSEVHDYYLVGIAVSGGSATLRLTHQADIKEIGLHGLKKFLAFDFLKGNIVEGVNVDPVGNTRRDAIMASFLDNVSQNYFSSKEDEFFFGIKDDDLYVVLDATYGASFYAVCAEFKII